MVFGERKMKIKIELEEEQWGYVLDAISESEAKAEQYAQMWEGRCREQQYRDEEICYSDLYNEIGRQLDKAKVEE